MLFYCILKVFPSQKYKKDLSIKVRVHCLAFALAYAFAHSLELSPKMGMWSGYSLVFSGEYVMSQYFG